MRPAATLLLCLTAATAFAQARLPLAFDRDPGFRPMPSYLQNVAAKPEVIVADGSVTLRVSEPGKGMKYQLDLQPFDSAYSPYLVLRYRAENLAGGYALWAYDGTQGGLQILNVGELTQDGQWHEVAIDMAACGVSGSIRALVSEVQCAEQPASLTFDSLTLTDEPPAGATLVPKVAAPEKETVVKLADLPLPEAHRGWLGNPALQFGADKRAGALHPVMSPGETILDVKHNRFLPDFLRSLLTGCGMVPTAMSKYAMCCREITPAAWGDPEESWEHASVRTRQTGTLPATSESIERIDTYE